MGSEKLEVQRKNKGCERKVFNGSFVCLQGD